MNRVPLAFALLALHACVQPAPGSQIEWNLRRQVTEGPDHPAIQVVYEHVSWDAAKTAVVICDMWDRHWCRGATARVAELAPRVNQLAAELRERGALIIHCPSDTMPFYHDTPARRRAQLAPAVTPAVPLATWCGLDPDQEPPLPIDDSDGGCDCVPACRTRTAWTRQIDSIEILDGDAITDSAEAHHLMAQAGIENVVVMGVHLNMCVLGRPFAIRQMVGQGRNVVLVRDLTDTMYNSRSRPLVSHFTGTDLVVEHVERYWCATVSSDQLLGGTPFRFTNDRRKHLAMILAEDEYDTRRTLPEFARAQLGREFKVSLVTGDARRRNTLPGIELLAHADAALISVRRWPLPEAELEILRRFVADGKPLVGIRTASHAFALRDGETAPEGLSLWPEFDHQVLGGNYHGHHSSTLAEGVRNEVWLVPEAVEHPILKGLPTGAFPVRSWLYRTLPLAETTTVLMMGRVGDLLPHQPVAWIHTGPGGGRVFYTSLGHPEDFQIPAFTSLLRNGIYWATGLPVPVD